LALADEFQESLQTYPGQIKRRPEAGALFSPECFEALTQELGVAAPKQPSRREWPAGLTDREVEVLQV